MSYRNFWSIFNFHFSHTHTHTSERGHFCRSEINSNYELTTFSCSVKLCFYPHTENWNFFFSFFFCLVFRSTTKPSYPSEESSALTIPLNNMWIHLRMPKKQHQNLSFIFLLSPHDDFSSFYDSFNLLVAVESSQCLRQIINSFFLLYLHSVIFLHKFESIVCSLFVWIIQLLWDLYMSYQSKLISIICFDSLLLLLDDPSTRFLVCHLNTRTKKRKKNCDMMKSSRVKRRPRVVEEKRTSSLCRQSTDFVRFSSLELNYHFARLFSN